MRTMYIVTATVYNPADYDYNDRIMNQYNTYEEAHRYAETYIERTNWYEGSWKIWAKTIDEATFTVEEALIQQYDYTEEHRGERYKEEIAACIKYMIALEQNKSRCRTVNDIIKKDREIAAQRQKMEQLKIDFANWQEKRFARKLAEQRKG